MLRSLLLFIHVASAMVLVAGYGIEGLVLAQLRRASSVPDARTIVANYRSVQIIAGSGLGLAVLTGIYLATAYWAWRGPWIGIAFLLIIVTAIIGGVMSGRTVAALRRESPPTTASDAAILPRARGMLAASFAMRLSLLVGVVFLMTVKPANTISLLAAGIAAAAALVIGLPLLRRRAVARR